MGQWRDDLQMIAGLLGAGMDTQGGFQMLMDANTQRDVRQDERKMMVNQLAQQFTPATATTTYNDLSQDIQATAPALGIGQGVVNKTLDRLQPLYEYGNDNVSVLAASWDEQDDMLIMEDIQRMVQSDPRFLQNRALLRDSIRAQWAEKLGPEIMADLDSKFDEAIDKGYTAVGGATSEANADLHATPYDEAQAQAKGMDLREYMGAQEGWIGQANAQDQGGFFSGWGALDWVDDNLLFGLLDDASKVSGGEPLDNPSGPDVGLHLEELPGLGADVLQNLAAVGIGKAAAPIFGAVGRGTANLAGRVLPKEADMLIRGLTGVAGDDVAGLAGLAERYGQGALRLPSMRNAASRITRRGGQQVPGEEGAEAVAKAAAEGLPPEYATAIGNAISDVRALGAGGGMASHLPFGRLARGRGLNAFAGGGAAVNPIDELITSAGAGAPGQMSFDDLNLDMQDFVPGATTPAPAQVPFQDLIGGGLTPEAQAIDDILRGGATEKVMAQESRGLSGLADDIVPEQQLADEGNSYYDDWDPMDNAQTLEDVLGPRDGALFKNQIPELSDEELTIGIELAQENIANPQAREYLQLAQDELARRTVAGGAAPLAEARATGLNSLPDNYIQDDELLQAAHAQNVRETEWMLDDELAGKELDELLETSSANELAQWMHLERKASQAGTTSVAGSDDFIATEIRDDLARMRTQAASPFTAQEAKALAAKYKDWLHARGMEWDWRAQKLLKSGSVQGRAPAGQAESGDLLFRSREEANAFLEQASEAAFPNRFNPTTGEVARGINPEDNLAASAEDAVSGSRAFSTDISTDIPREDMMDLINLAETIDPEDMFRIFGEDSLAGMIASYKEGHIDMADLRRILEQLQ